MLPYLQQAGYKSFKGFKAQKSVCKNEEIVKQEIPIYPYTCVFLHFLQIFIKSANFYFSHCSFLEKVLCLINEPVKFMTIIIHVSGQFCIYRINNNIV